jgi:hypothetical protein
MLTMGTASNGRKKRPMNLSLSVSAQALYFSAQQ